MFFVTVLMVVCVNPKGESFSESPDTDRYEHQAHGTFTPYGECFEIEEAANQEDDRTDDGDACGVAESPENADQRGTVAVGDRKGSHGGQVVGAG
jgi:hypothetical protein